MSSCSSSPSSIGCTSSIQVRCPHCPSSEVYIQSPEELCGHMAQYHGTHSIMQSKCFESFAYFQIWLANIEDSRCDGGYLGSSQGPSYEDVSFKKNFNISIVFRYCYLIVYTCGIAPK